MITNTPPAWLITRVVGDPGREPQPTTGTLPHRQLHDLLVDMGFDVEDELSVPPFSLDCYLREIHLGFEADGELYHSGQSKRRRDAERDRVIFDHFGIKVLRVRERELAVPAEAEDIIQGFINEHAETTETRRLIGRGLL